MIRRPLFERFAQDQRNRERAFVNRVALLWAAAITLALVVALT